MKNLLLLILTISQLTVASQIVVDNTITPEEIVALLVGTGVSYSNVTYSGEINQFGSFLENGSGIGLEDGIIMGTGDVDLAVGPNDQDGASLGGGGFDDSDIDLENLSNVNINDAAILEFDFIPQGNSISFLYVFGSEEYNEYVCGGVNDAFGFFLSGPGISGTYSSPTAFPNGSSNIALVPGTNIGVSIGTVNNGTVGSNGFEDDCNALDPNWQSNSIYYNDNGGSTTIQYDGLTVVLEATHSVECGETYHIKLAIGDGGDSVFDSGVFLETNSFSSEVPVEVDMSIDQSTPVENGVYELCGGAILYFTRNGNDLSNGLTVDLMYSGEAINGLDYDLPTSITFPANVSVVELVFNPFMDGIIETVENLLITMSYENSCDNQEELELIEMFILDVEPITLATEDFILCGDEQVELVPTITGGIGEISYNWSTSETTETIFVSSDGPLQYMVVVTDECEQTDSVSGVFNISSPPPPSLNYPPQVIEVVCGESTDVECEIIGDYLSISYSTNDGVFLGNTNPIIYDASLGAEFLIVELLDNCNQIIELEIPIDVLINIVPTVELDSNPFTTINEACGETVLSFSLTGNDLGNELVVDLIYTGIATNGLDYNLPSSITFPTNESLIEIVFNPTMDGEIEFLEDLTIVMIYEDPCGNQVELGLLELFIADYEPLTLTTVDMELCEDEASILTPIVTGGIGNYNYEWSTLETSTTISIVGNEPVTYTVLVSDECGETESISDVFEITINEPPAIDFPPGSISFTCEDFIEVECQVTGDYETISYVTNLGSELSTSNPYTYDTSVGAESLLVTVIDVCDQEAQVTIPVVQIFPPVLTLDIGEDFSSTCTELNMLEADVQGGEGPFQYSWYVDGGVVVEDGLTFAIQTNETVEVSFEVTDACGTSVNDQLIVIIPINSITLEVTENQLVCPGLEVTLAANAEGGVGDFTYSWSAFGVGAEHEFIAESSQEYTVVATDGCGVSVVGSVFIEVVEFDITYAVSSISENSYTFESYTFPPCESDCSFFWDFGDNSTSTQENVEHEFDGLGVYNGSLSVVNSLGCIDSVNFTVYPPITIYLPNSFTPNGDGINDVFRVHGIGVLDYEIKMYNRWGSIVYHSKDINEVWVGEVSERMYYAQNEAYSYVITAIGYDTNSYTQKGVITVIR